MKKHRRVRTKLVLGVAWYREEQWSRLREVCADSNELEETHAEWLAIAEKKCDELAAMGVKYERVDVDVEALVAWCRSTNCTIDQRARAEYVAEWLRQRAIRRGQ